MTDRIPFTLRLGKESGEISVGLGSDDRYWFSATVDDEGSYMAFDVPEEHIRGLLAFLDTVRGD